MQLILVLSFLAIYFLQFIYIRRLSSLRKTEFSLNGSQLHTHVILLSY